MVKVSIRQIRPEEKLTKRRVAIRRNEIKYQDRQPNELFNNSLASQIQEKMKNKK